MKKINVNEIDILNDYNDGYSLPSICKKYKIGKLRAKDIIIKNGGKIRDCHEKRIIRKYIIDDYHIKKYEDNDMFYYVAIAKNDKSVEFIDCENKGGYLTSYIKKELGIQIPTLYERRIYYQTTGNYWWEQWFDVEKRKVKDIKKCPYCDWFTIDVENKSGAFETHIKNNHNIDISEHLINYPDDINYFSKYKQIKERDDKLKKENGYVICPICKEKFRKLTISHIKNHGYSLQEFKEKYPDVEMMSIDMQNQSKEAFKLANLTVSKNRFISSYERELQDFLRENNIIFEANRQILIGKEIDILIPDLRIGIEFNGLKWHTEWFGKKRHGYHLEKTKLCNEKGYGLIHIFEDEYVNKRDIVYNKLRHILHLNKNLNKIYARNCIVKQVYKHDAEIFLNKYHIQGFASATVYLGCFYNDTLIAVMGFKNGNLKNPWWELVRFATTDEYICVGVGGKLFKYFIKNYEAEKVISFADRRWTINPYDNLYIKLGFVLDKFNAPDYRYYKDDSKNGLKFERIHKMKFNKKKISKEYGLPLTLTETEMAKELGYDRIWDCGLIKYVWKHEG